MMQCAMRNRGFHLRNWRWPSRDLGTFILDQTNNTILCLPSNQITFVWNIFPYFLYFSKYLPRANKIKHPYRGCSKIQPTNFHRLSRRVVFTWTQFKWTQFKWIQCKWTQGEWTPNFLHGSIGHSANRHEIFYTEY